MLTDNFIVRGNSGTEIDIGNITMSADGNDLNIPGSIEIENGSIALPSLNFASHITTGLSASVTGLELSVNGIEGLGIRTSTTPVNGLLIEMANTGDGVNIVPVGPDGSIDFVVRAKGGNLVLNNLIGEVHLGVGPVMIVKNTGTEVIISGDITATSFNGVALTTAGVSSNFLDETGNYSVPTDTGGQVDSVVSGTNITIDATDPVNPIANLDAAITGTSVNGVTLATGGAATNFLNQTGNYSTPAGTGNVTTSSTLTDNFIVIGNGTEDVDVTTASFSGDNLTIVGSATIVNGFIATPSLNFTSHITTGLSASTNRFDLSVNGVLGIGIVASTIPVNGLFVEMSDTGNGVNLVPQGTDGTIDLIVRAKGANVRINQIAGDTFIGIGDQIQVDNGGSTGIGRGVGTPSVVLDVATEASDTIPIARFSSTVTDSGSTRLFCGNNDPNTHVTGFPGDVYHRDSGELSGSWESLEATSGTEWFSRGLNPPTIRMINNIAQFEDLVSTGTFTVLEDTLLIMNTKVVTASNISIVFGFKLSVIGRYKGDVGFNYTGASTFISGEGSFIATQECNLESVGTGQLFDITNKAAIVIMKEIKLDGWDDLGEIVNAALIIDTVEMDNITVGLTLTNPREVVVTKIFQDGVAMVGSLFTFTTIAIGEIYSFKDIRSNLTSTGSIFDFSPDIPPTTQIAVSECLADIGNIFKQTQIATDAFTLVSDSAVSNTITAAVDNGSGLVRFSSSEDIFNGELVTTSGFTTNTAYNGTFKAFNIVLGVSFDVNVLIGTTETGNLSAKRVLFFSAGNSFSNGDTVEVTNSQFYNGFYRVLDSTTNEVEVNHSFEGTDIGTMSRDVGLDERDPRIKAFNNFSDNANSSVTLFAERNGNDVETPVSSGATFYSTVQVNVINSQSTQRFRMISSQISAYIYTGIETITVPVVATFTVIKNGGDGDYRAAVTKNDVDPTSENDGFVPMVITTQKSSWTYESIVTLSTGDEIVAKLVGDGTSVAPTITDFRLIVG